MAKLFKRIAIIGLILFILIIGIIGYLLSLKPVLTIPFTYTITENLGSSLALAEKSDILIIGDRMGKFLDQFLEPMKIELAKGIGRQPIVYNWSRENEGLHRSLYKVQQLKKLPTLIIYHGGSSEWFETKFLTADKSKIIYNFNQYKDEKIISLILTFPDLSRAFYKKTARFVLGKLDPKHISKVDSDFETKEIEYMYFDHELSTLIDHIKRNRSNILMITTPLNIAAPPKQACPISSTNTIVEVQQEIENLIKEGNFKEAYSKSVELNQKSISNSKSAYLLGVTAQNNSELKIARESFTNANVFDCYNWRGNGVFNSIIKTRGFQYQTEVLDFAAEIQNLQLQNDEVFFDDIYPQNLYYNKLIEELTISIKKYMSIKER